MHVGNGRELNPRRRDGVESRQLAAGSIEGQRKRLGAVPKKITAGNNIVLVKVMVDLGDHAAQVVVRRSDQRCVRAPRAACVLTGAGDRRRTTKGSRNVRLGPKSQQRSGYDARGTAG